MTWLVVGSSGQLGKSVTDILLNLNIDFTTLNRTNGLICDENYIADYINRIKPDVILNCAAWTDVDGAESDEAGAREVNADLVGYLASAARTVQANFTHISTDYVFSGLRTEPWHEDSEKKPISAYGRTKAIGEDLVLSIYPERSHIYRTAWLYSCYGKNFAKTMLRLALRNSNPVNVVNDQIGQPTFAHDLASQVISSELAGIPYGIYHGTNSGQASWFDFAREIFRLSGSDVERVQPISSEAFVRPAKRPTYSVLGHQKWASSGIDEMQDWKLALENAMPGLISSVKAEE